MIDSKTLIIFLPLPFCVFFLGLSYGSCRLWLTARATLLTALGCLLLAVGSYCSPLRYYSIRFEYNRHENGESARTGKVTSVAIAIKQSSA